MPRFIGCAGPPQFLVNRMRRTGTGAPLARASTRSGVLSVDASSTTRISTGSSVCSKVDLIASAINAEPLYDGTMTDMVGCVSISCYPCASSFRHRLRSRADDCDTHLHPYQRSPRG